MRPFALEWRDAVYSVDGRVLSWRGKAVAGPVSTHMDKNGGSIRPSVDLLAAESGLSPRTVDTALRELRESGFLVVERKGGGRHQPTLYGAAIPELTTHDVHGFARRNDARRDKKRRTSRQETTHDVRRRTPRESAQEDVARARAREDTYRGSKEEEADRGYTKV